MSVCVRAARTETTMAEPGGVGAPNVVAVAIAGPAGELAHIAKGRTTEVLLTP